MTLHRCTQFLDDGERCTNEYECAPEEWFGARPREVVNKCTDSDERCDSCERTWTKYGMVFKFLMGGYKIAE